MNPTLKLLGHPLSSYCQKVLIAADAMAIPVQLEMLNLGDPEVRAAHRALWPTGQMPVLVDGERAIGESSIVIEYLQHHPSRSGPPVIPAEFEAALEVRLWDRLFDNQVMAPMQALTADRLRPAGQGDATGVSLASERLVAAYTFIDRHLHGREWACGERFSLADCAAAPALFYATAYVPLAAAQSHLAGYLERLLAHPPVARTIEAARPFFPFFPGRDGLAPRYRQQPAA